MSADLVGAAALTPEQQLITTCLPVLRERMAADGLTAHEAAERIAWERSLGPSGLPGPALRALRHAWKRIADAATARQVEAA